MLTRKQRIWVSGLALPALILFTLFGLVPLGLVLVLSFTNYTTSTSSLSWVGGANWIRLAQDSMVVQGIGLTILVMGLCWIFQTGLGLMIGVFLAGRQRYRVGLGVLYFLPIVFSSAAIAVAWENLMAPYSGGLALTLEHIGIHDPVLWLATPGQAIYVVIAAICWQFVPFQSTLFLAATRQIPHELYDAATIDGAGRMRTFTRITIPQLRNTIVTSSILVLVGSLLYFDLFLIMTDGGPATSTTVLSMAMYIRGFESDQQGYGSAIATVLVFVGLLLSLAIVKVSGFGSMRSQQEGL